MSFASSHWPLIAITVSLTALLVTFLNFRRKSSVSLRGGYTLASSVDCDEQYVSAVVLENMKDRAVTIYGIYLLVGHNYLIEIDEFDESPLILRPFETLKRSYGPIEFYGVSLRRLNMSRIMEGPDIRRRLVLSTSEGRYAIRSYPRRWSPVLDHFRNHAFALVKPIRSTYKQKDIGGNVRFVVDVVLSDNKSEVIMLRSEDHQYRRFRGFRFSPESLESADAMRSFLAARQEDGALICKSFQVFDVKEWRDREREHYSGSPIDAEYIGFFSYFVLCRIATIRSDWRLRRENAKRAKQTDARNDI